MNRTLAIFFLSLLISCLSPEDVSVETDMDLIALDQTIELSAGQDASVWRKKVVLDTSEEETILNDNAAIIENDLSMLFGSSFSRIITPTNYRKIITDTGVLFERRAQERKGPLSVLIVKNSNNEIFLCRVKFSEDNYLFESSKSVEVKFNKGKIASYIIKGSRKIIGLDPSSYQIEGSLVE